jgi:hypothetical protein
VRRAMRRKPSCLISWSQSAPAGGVSAGDGRQGSMKPAARPVRSNMTNGLQGPDGRVWLVRRRA